MKKTIYKNLRTGQTSERVEDSKYPGVFFLPDIVDSENGDILEVSEKNTKHNQL